jgi:hypothetical protein
LETLTHNRATHAVVTKVSIFVVAMMPHAIVFLHKRKIHIPGLIDPIEIVVNHHITSGVGFVVVDLHIVVVTRI